jgi:hypothetical protein
MCPTGMSAVGGGVTPVSPLDSDNYRVQVSGRVDETTFVSNTENGDVPRGWAATVSHAPG